jgi:FkbM family methyltransferase
MTQFVERMRGWRHQSLLAGAGPVWSALRPAWQTALWIGSRGRGFVHEVNGTDRLRIDIRQAPHAAPIVWEPDDYAAVMAEVRRGDHVIDVGAFSGLYALGAALRVGAEGCIVAIEASPHSARRLRANVRVNRLGAIIRVVEAVCADRADERISFYASRDGGMTDSVVGGAGSNGARALQLPTTTIDAVVRDLNLHPRVMKIDVEGYEDLVLRGAAETLRRHRPVVFLELHPEQLAARGIAAATIIDELAETGLTCADTRLGNGAIPAGILFAFRPTVR